MPPSCVKGYKENEKGKGPLHNCQNYHDLNPDSWLETLMHAGLGDTHMVAKRIYPVNRSFLWADLYATLGADIVSVPNRPGRTAGP